MRKSVTKINREIRALAIPNVISNVSVPLISSVDTFLMGQLSPLALAAVGLGSMVFNFLYWNMGFLRMGTTGMTAQAFGRNDQADIQGVLLKAGALGLVISFVFILLQVPLFDFASWAMSVHPEQISDVWSYFGIRIYAAPASLLLMVLMGWLFGMQNARYPLFITLFINVVNIVVSVLLVKQMELGIKGVAWGTLIAQYLGVIFCILLMVLLYPNILKRATWKWKAAFVGFTSLLKINADIFLRTVFLSTAFVLIFRFSEAAGPDYLAINVVFMQFMNWMSYAIDGFAFAAESLVGKYKGAQDSTHLQLAINWNMIWGLVFACVFSLVYYVFAEDIFKLFMESDDGRYLSLARQSFIWMTIMPIVGFGSYIWDGIYVGLTASVAMRNTMIAAFIVYLISYSLMPPEWNNDRIWSAFFLFLIARGVFQWLLYQMKGWEDIK